MLYKQQYQSPLGEMLMFSEGSSLTGLCFPDDRYCRAQRTDEAAERELPVFLRTRAWLDIYFAGREPDFLPPLRLAGSSFQQQVWQLLLDIPYGQLLTYKELAAKTAAALGRRVMAAQAAGGAVGRNPVCIIVPCHRVVGSDGSLVGYGAGLERKQALLQLEGVSLQNSFVVPGKK